MKKLIAHTAMHESIFGVPNTVGKTYSVIIDEEKDYVILDDQNTEMSLAKEPNRHGLSYKDWFDLVE